MLRVIRDMWTEAVNCPAEVVVGALDKIILLHVWFDGVVDCCYGSVEEATAKITEVLILRIFPSACGT